VIHARDLGKIMVGYAVTVVWRDGGATPLATVSYHVLPRDGAPHRTGSISWRVRATNRLREPRVANLLLAPGTLRFGTRWWLTCPKCTSRRAHLFLIDGMDWRCRVCAGLGYRSQQLAEYDRIDYRARKIAHDRLGATWIPDAKNHVRPRRMHRHTFERHCATLGALEQRREWLDRVIGARLLGWINTGTARRLRRVRARHES